MGISYAPSILEQLGGPGAIEHLGDAIAHIVNPDYKFQQTMKATLAIHPELAQELANLEANAPGTLKAMHLGPLADTIGKIPESPDNQIARTHREQILGIKGQDLANKETAGKVESQDLKNKGNVGAEIAKIIATDPNAARDIARRAAGLPTTAEGKIQESEATIKGNEATVSAAETPVKLDQADLAYRDLEKVKSQYATLSGVNVTSVANDMATGKDVPNFNLLMQIDGFAKAFPMALRARELDMARTQQRFLKEEALNAQSQHIKERAEDRLDAQQQHEADMEYYKSGRGSSKAWLEAVRNPDAVRNALDKVAKDPENASNMELDLADIGKYQQTTNQTKAALDQAKIQHAVKQTNADLDKDINTLNRLVEPGANKKVEPTLVNAKLAEINQKLASKGRNIRLNYGKIPDSGIFRDKTGLYYTENGKKIDDSEANAYRQSEVIAPTQQGKSGELKLTKRQQDLLDAWKKDTPENRSKFIVSSDSDMVALRNKGLLQP